MTATAGDTLNVARSLLGIRENPDGSNRAAPVTYWYGMHAAWCAMTVSYCLDHAGGVDGIRFAWCPTGVAKFKSGEWGQWIPADGTPEPGDLVFFSFGRTRPDHVGFVETVEARHIGGLEGNVGNACKRTRRARTGAGIIGYGRPRYAGGDINAPAVPAVGGLGVRTLARGTSGPDVAALQAILVGAGLLPADGVDGDFGPRTEGAVRILQGNLGVEVDGIVGAETRAAVGRLLAAIAAQASRPPANAPAPLPNLPTLRVGSRGDFVRWAQARLEQHGCPPGRIDGLYGDRTAQAVRRFQARRGLPVDGVIGPVTWGYLEAI